MLFLIKFGPYWVGLLASKSMRWPLLQTTEPFFFQHPPSTKRFDLGHHHQNKLTMALSDYLKRLEGYINEFVAIHQNDFDTSPQDEKAERLQRLLELLKRHELSTTTTATTMQASVGKGGDNDPEDVRWVQEKLNDNGASLKVDGKAGPKTNNAIGAFQTDNDLPKTKLIQPEDDTHQLLEGKSSGAPTDEPTGSVMQASVGEGGANDPEDVRWVQEKLNDNGASLKVDGDCGPKTKNAIGAFQKDKELPENKLVEPGDQTHQALEGKTPTDQPTDEPTDGPTDQPVASLKNSVGEGGNNDKEDVIWVQEKLNDNGASLKVDGDCGPKTKNAIGAFQTDQGISETKLIEPGDDTHQALEGKAPSDQPTDGPSDQPTDEPTDQPTDEPKDTPVNSSIQKSVGKDGVNEKEDVRTVQSLLKNDWDYKIDINGEADDPTIQAIRQFQHRYAGMIRSQDARVDPNGTTWKYLTGALKPTMGKTDDGIVGGVETKLEKQMAEFTQAFSGIVVTLKSGEKVTVRPPYHINLGNRKKNAEAARKRNNAVQKVADSLGYFAKAGKATPGEIQEFLQTCIDKNLVKDTTSQGMHEFLSLYGISTDCSGLAVQAANFLLEGDMDRPDGPGKETVPIMNTQSIQGHPEVSSPTKLQAGDMMVNYKREGTSTYHVRVLVDVDKSDDTVSFTTVESTASSSVGDGGDGVGQRRWKFPDKSSFDNLQALLGNDWKRAGASDQAYIYVRLRQMKDVKDE